MLEHEVSDRADRLQGHLSSEGIPVSVTTLDTLVVGKEILPPKYIKMDIEGAELLALRGAETTVREFHPTIFLQRMVTMLAASVANCWSLGAIRAKTSVPTHQMGWERY